MLRVCLSFLCIAGLAALSGCDSGPKVNYVEGKVTLDGAPLAGATVTFSPVEGGSGRPAAGVTDSDGVYKLSDLGSEDVGSGAAVGEYQVAIVKISGGEDEDPDAWMDDPNYGDMPDPTATGAGEMKSEVPDNYTRPATSELTATIESGRNENVDFELTSSP